MQSRALSVNSHALASIACIRRTLGAPRHIQVAEFIMMEKQFPGFGWGELAEERAKAAA